MPKQRFVTLRTSTFIGCGDKPKMMQQGTWIEAESMCYPQGGMHRGAGHESGQDK